MSSQVVTYCRHWSLGYNEAFQPLTEKQARKAHDSHKEYCAILGDPKTPSSFVHFNRGSIGITWLDNYLRPNMTVSFGERNGALIFLDAVTGRAYTADSEQPDETLVLYFNLDGTGHRHHWLPDGSFEKADMRWDDMSSHWKPYPEFGHYDDLIHAPNAWLEDKLK